jgi:hypothetical protein
VPRGHSWSGASAGGVGSSPYQYEPSDQPTESPTSSTRGPRSAATSAMERSYAARCASRASLAMIWRIARIDRPDGMELPSTTVAPNASGVHGLTQPGASDTARTTSGRDDANGAAVPS